MGKASAKQRYECTNCGKACETADMDVAKRVGADGEDEWSTTVCPSCGAWNSPIDEFWLKVAVVDVETPRH